MTVRDAWAVTIGAFFLTVLALALVVAGEGAAGLVCAVGSLAVIGMGGVAGVRAVRRRKRGWTAEDDEVLNEQKRLR